MNPIRILIADDSATVRGIWKKIFSESPDFVVAALAENGKKAVDLVGEVKADLVLLDIEMPVMDGLTALPLLFKARPGVRVIMASSLTKQGSSAAIHALALGAADYVAKPSSTSLGASISQLSSELLQKARSLKYPTRNMDLDSKKMAPPAINAAKAPILSSPQVIVLGCSTGGPNALITVLKGLNFDLLQLPIVIVQHMPAYFINLLAERVTRETGRTCKVISGDETLDAKFLGIAPGEFHVEISREGGSARLRLNQNPPENFCRPAVDPLFRSASEVFGSGVLAIVLTGMGEDGRRGCEAIRQRNGAIIVQDEESSVVWGMPGAVAKEGLANAILPLGEIANAIQSVCQRGRISA